MSISIVDKNNNEALNTIQEAVNICKPGDIIQVKKGVYKEKLVVEKDFITIVGENKENTIITNDDYAFKIIDDGSNMGTFRSYTILVGGNNINISNITIENSSGDGDEVGQAIAAYVDGDQVFFENCRFLGCQDTLFIGPLPPKPKIKGSFIGPREGVPYKRSRQYYEKCYIQGDVDFIFGSGLATFKDCQIHSNDRHKDVNGYITAASTPKEEKVGFIFINCRLTSDAKKPSVYLGRPWREYAKVSFINCYMGPHILPEGWDDWSNKENRKTADFREYNSYGPGGNNENRVDWASSFVIFEKNFRLP